MDIAAWLRALGLGQYEPAFRDNDIDAAILRTLTADDLKELGVRSLGHRQRLLAAIAALKGPAEGPGAHAGARHHRSRPRLKPESSWPHRKLNGGS